MTRLPLMLNTGLEHLRISDHQSTHSEATLTRVSRLRLSRRTIRPSALYSRYTRYALAGDPRRLSIACKRR